MAMWNIMTGTVLPMWVQDRRVMAWSTNNTGIHITKIHKRLWQIALKCMCSSRWDTVCCIDVFLSGGRVTHICVSKLDSIGSDVACSGTRHFFNQCWFIVNWTLGNKLQWNTIKLPQFSFRKNACENIFCDTASILSRSQCILIESDRF